MSFWSWRDFSDRAACGHSGARYTVLLDSLADGVMGGRPCTISGGGCLGMASRRGRTMEGRKAISQSCVCV